MSTVVGFDFGLARIGVAIGSLDSGHAEPLTTLSAKDGRPDWNRLAELVASWQPTTFVVGNPRRVCGHGRSRDAPPPPARLSKRLTEFRDALRTRFELPVESVDETYTSTEARHLLAERRRAGWSRKTHKDEIDMVAAAVILQSWLSRAR